MPSHPRLTPRTTRPLRLTPRDQELLNHLSTFSTLSTEQVQALCFPSLSRARKRLRRLWEHGLVRRTVRPVHVGDGTSPYYYAIARTGLTCLPAYTGTDQFRLPKLLTPTAHTLQAINFRVLLTLTAQRTRSFEIVRWIPDRQLRFVGAARIGDRTIQVPIIPDGFFVLRQAGRDFAYFLEVDRGTMDYTRLREKCIAYLDLWHGPTVRQRLGVRSFRVLYVTSSERRTAGLLDTIRQIVPNGLRRDILLCTSSPKLSLDKPEVLLGSIWQIIDTDGAVSRSRLLPSQPPLMLPIVPGNPPVSEPDVGAR